MIIPTTPRRAGAEPSCWLRWSACWVARCSPSTVGHPTSLRREPPRAELEALITGGVEARDLLLEALQATEHGPESFGQRHAWLEEYTNLGPGFPDPFGWRIRRTYWAASLAFESGRLGELKGHLDDWGHVAEVLGVRYWDWKLSVARASDAFAHGRLAEAEERAMASLVIAGDLYSDMTFRTSEASCSPCDTNRAAWRTTSETCPWRT